MPVYPYRCEAGHEVDLVHAPGAAPGACPECAAPLQRIWTAPPVHFKGKGFTATDVGTQRQRKLLERAAEQGANDHDDKMREKRAKARRDTAP